MVCSSVIYNSPALRLRTLTLWSGSISFLIMLIIYLHSTGVFFFRTILPIFFITFFLCTACFVILVFTSYLYIHLNTQRIQQCCHSLSYVSQVLDMNIFHWYSCFLFLAAWWSSSVLFSLGVLFTRKICPLTEIRSKGFQPIWFTIMFPTMMLPSRSAWTVTCLRFPSTAWTTSVRCFCQVMGQAFAKVMTPGYWNRQAYHAVVRMKTLALTVGTQIKVRTLNALVAKTFHLFLAPITWHTNMQLGLTFTMLLCRSAMYCYIQFTHFSLHFRQSNHQLFIAWYDNFITIRVSPCYSEVMPIQWWENSSQFLPKVGATCDHITVYAKPTHFSCTIILKEHFERYCTFLSHVNAATGNESRTAACVRKHKSRSHDFFP